MRAQTLVKMANQIAVSVPDQSMAAQQTAAHLRTFWTPQMIRDLADHAASHPDDLTQTAREALATLQLRATQQ